MYYLIAKTITMMQRRIHGMEFLLLELSHRSGAASRRTNVLDISRLAADVRQSAIAATLRHVYHSEIATRLRASQALQRYDVSVFYRLQGDCRRPLHCALSSADCNYL